MPPSRSRRRASDAPHIYVVGAGISGLTAALRLLERGYRVTIYEEKAVVGGNLAGFEADGGVRHLPAHVRRLVPELLGPGRGRSDTDAGDGPDAAFQPGTPSRSSTEEISSTTSICSNVGPKASPWSGLLSGLASPADMFLWAYLAIDGLWYLARRRRRAGPDERGRIYASRAYATPAVAALQDVILMTIWSIHSDETSSAAYRRFLEHNAPLSTPLVWLLTGNLGIKLMQPPQAEN